MEEQAAEISEIHNRLIRLAEENTLLYDDLAIGERLHRYVAEYTFFDSFDTNEAFLAVLNRDDDTTDDGLCVRLRDPVATSVSNILVLVGIPFGWQVEVNKGFLIKNLCVLLEIGCIRPPKKLKGQTQQSVEDSALAQKIGNTHIVIENLNGGAKDQGRYFNGMVSFLCYSLAWRLF
jgi:hypothetical protein